MPSALANVPRSTQYLEFRYVEIVVNEQPPPTQCARTVAGDYTTPVHLGCTTPGATMDAVAFAAWGTPGGSCTAGGAPAGNSFFHNASCDASGAAAIVTSTCVGRTACTLIPSDAFFNDNKDPCHLVEKWLAVAVTCNSHGDRAGAVDVVNAAADSAPVPYVISNVTAWVVTYPAAYIDKQVIVPDETLQAVWDLCQYTVVATALDLYTDSNTRQRSVICSEAMLISLYMQYATSLEFALPLYTLEYMLNHRPVRFVLRTELCLHAARVGVPRLARVYYRKRCDER